MYVNEKQCILFFPLRYPNCYSSRFRECSILSRGHLRSRGVPREGELNVACD